MTDTLDQIIIPDRSVREPEAAVARVGTDNTDHLRHFCFDPLEDHTPSPKYSAQFTGIRRIPRAAVVSWTDYSYPTRHAPESKTKDLMPNVLADAAMTAGEIRKHLQERLGYNHDGRKRGIVFLDMITGFDDAMGDALQMLCLPFISSRLSAIEGSLRARVGLSLDGMAALSTDEILSSPLSETRKNGLVERVLAAVRYLKTAPVARWGVTTKEAWPSFNEALALMLKACGEGARYAKSHARRQEYELSESTRKNPGKNELDDYDLKIYQALGEEPPEKTDNLKRTAQTAGATAGRFDPHLPTKNCIACYSLIPTPSAICTYCQTPQSAAGLAGAVAPQPVGPPPDDEAALAELLGREAAPPGAVNEPAPGIAAGNLAPPETTTIRSTATPSAAAIPREKFQVPAGDGAISIDDL